MLELVAQVDPMALPVWAVLLLSAAMYPLGFMLGAPCSACCCKPCNKCTHGYSTTNGCYFPDILTALAFEFSHFGSLTQTPTSENWTCMQIPTGALPKVSLDYFYAEICIRTLDGPFPPDIDECGCLLSCSFGAQIRISLVFDGNPHFTLLSNLFVGAFGDCSQTSASLQPLGAVSFAVWEEEYPYPEEIESIVEYFENLPLTGFLTANACECGPCCTGEPYEPAECEDNVPLAQCQSDYQVWKGVGAVCDEVNCSSGACCTGSACVAVLDENSCPDASYFAGQSCEPNPCIGACCDYWVPDGCSQTFSNDCAGYYWQFGDCEGVCDPPLGSCVVNGVCTETFQGDCTGVWSEAVRCP